MVDLDSLVSTMPADVKLAVLGALKILADLGVFSSLARANSNQLVVDRMDSTVTPDELAMEIRETRQTNRILLGLEQSSIQLTKGMTNA